MDADWAEDRSDSESHSAGSYFYIMEGGAIAWASRKQTCTPWSSCEAEYIAIGEANREGIAMDTKIAQGLRRGAH